MNVLYADLLASMKQIGWQVEALPRSQPLPEDVSRRYPWMPQDYRELIEETRLASSPDDKAWLVTVSDFAMNTESAYAWNEWERQSLEAAGGDHEWKRRIEAFWDTHMPVMMSVKSGYAYFAIEKEALRVVAGEEPEFEETVPIAPSIREMLLMVAARDSKLAKWL